MDEQYQKICRGEFAAIHAKLDHLDESIRGNGKPGIITRLDRLEIVERFRSRVLWMVGGVVITLATTSVWYFVTGGWSRGAGH